jgi:hypothetical protein
MTVQPVASRYTDFAIPPALCRPKYPLKIQFLPHRQQIASPLQRRTFVSVLSTGLLMVRGKLTSLSCCLLLFMEIVWLFIVRVMFQHIRAGYGTIQSFFVAVSGTYEYH